MIQKYSIDKGSFKWLTVSKISLMCVVSLHLVQYSIIYLAKKQSTKLYMAIATLMLKLFKSVLTSDVTFAVKFSSPFLNDDDTCLIILCIQARN